MKDKNNTIVKWDVVASVGSFKPAGHFFQHRNLSTDDHVWFGDVNVHIRIWHLIG